uniref:RRM_2 domain-containing protein n=1 Tax=Ascaris lumbricoides TaxID=6252 RepID=A0A0M3HZ07_ASCLU
MENAYLNNETQISGCEQANITSSALYMLPYSEFSQTYCWAGDSSINNQIDPQQLFDCNYANSTALPYYAKLAYFINAPLKEIEYRRGWRGFAAFVRFRNIHSNLHQVQYVRFQHSRI